MALQIEYRGEAGVFFLQDEFEKLEESVLAKNKRIDELLQEVAKAKGEQKYKLKKLSQIIERKDRQIALLQEKAQK